LLTTIRKGCGEGVSDPSSSNPTTGAVRGFVPVWVGFFFVFEKERKKKEVERLQVPL